MSIIKSNGAGESGGFYNGAVSTSLRFNRASAHYLSRDQGSAGNQKVFTLAFWVKRGIIGVADTALFGTQSDGNNRVYMRWEADDTFKVYFAIAGSAYDNGTTMKFRDTSAWYHIAVVVNMAGSGDTGKLKIYVNGVNQTVTYASTLPDANIAMCAGVAETLGKKDGASNYMDGYLADVYLIDGTAVGETSGYLDEFGEVKEGIWIPKKYTGSYGTNGFHLEFTSSAHDAPASEGSADTDNIGADSSGQNHHWTAVDSISADDCAMPDCPENNFATLNNISEVAPTLSEGNLVWTNMTQASTPTSTFTIPSTGKWYWEVRPTAIGEMMIGVQTRANLAYSGRKTVYYKDGGSGGGSGSIYIEGSGNGGDQAAYTNGDIIAVLYNADDMEISWRKNNTQQGLTFDVTDTDVTPIIHHGSGSGNNSGTFNFGQDSTFAGAVSAGGNADGNGKGDFAYAPPSGFLALCSANLPDLTIGPDSTTQADDHFETILYSASSGSAGAGSSTPQDIGGLDFKPDWVWIKGRSYSDHHFLADSSRGVGKYLLSNVSNAEGSVADTLDEFRSDGFGLGADSTALVNYQNNTYVAWNWKANGGTTTTNDASATSVGATDSVIQANTTAGFSIVTYTGTGSATTFAHGLGGVPEVMIIKNRTGGSHGWSGFYHHLMAGTAAASATDYLTLNGTGALVDDNTIWNDTPPTSTVFTVGTAANTGASKDYVGYFFRSIEGYSKFGIYTGNGNDDGPFVFTGFKPAWLLIKSTVHTESWHIWDNKRVLNGNPNQAILSPDTTGQDTGASTPYDIDFLSNGFKIRDTHDLHNGSGDTHIYLAFAEAPFKFANAR